MAKVKSVKALNDGMEESNAKTLWGNVEKFASYSFNKSHAVEYSLISYQSMWLKVYYPVEFYAAALTILEDKRHGLVKDATKHGIRVLPPDVNASTDEFEIISDEVLVAPFSVMNGLSSRGAMEIMKAREDGPFTSAANFEDRVPKRVVNKTVRAKLDAVGAFAAIEDQVPADHEDRRTSHLELIPSIVVGGGIIDRELHRDRATITMLKEELAAFRDDKGREVCENAVFVTPRMGKHAKFMAVFDGPGYHDERAGRFATDGIDAVEEALEEAGLEISDGYWTGLCKIPKAKDEKLYAPDVIHAFKPLLEREIEMLNPQIILVLGTNAARFFDPGMKGSITDHAGKVIYKKADDGLKNDRNIVIGITPGMIYFDGTKQEILNDAFKQIAEMIQ